jgi:uncharacterized protein
MHGAMPTCATGPASGLSVCARSVRRMATVRLTGEQARRIAIAAQGLAEPRPVGRIDSRHIRRVIDRIGLLQIDSVNVFARSHYLPVFARLGPYPQDTLDRMSAYANGVRRAELFEYWAHAASLMPVAYHPLLRWRMRRAHLEHWTAVRRIARENPGLLERMLQLVADQGPIVAGDTGIPRLAPRPGHMWNWHNGKIALEYLFYAGQVTTAKRVNFERYYDLVERVIPPEILNAPEPPEDDAIRELVRIAARALGVATDADLRDYFRISHRATKAAAADLIATGELIPAQVDGWSAPAYLWHDARRPRRVEARALLSPFDSLIWFRERTERVFDFRYRIEIYTPAGQRKFGYYVMPFLLGDQLVGRVDLKSDRQAGVLRVQSAWAEPGTDLRSVACQLAAELELTAGWQRLDGVVVMPRGNLAAELARHVSG